MAVCCEIGGCGACCDYGSGGGDASLDGGGNDGGDGGSDGGGGDGGSGDGSDDDGGCGRGNGGGRSYHMPGPSRGSGVPGDGAGDGAGDGGGSGGKGLSSSSSSNNPTNGFLGYSHVTSREYDRRPDGSKVLCVVVTSVRVQTCFHLGVRFWGSFDVVDARLQE